jgi:N-sulfoglucosamine sulfohydrolase
MPLPRCLVLLFGIAWSTLAADPPNLLIITVDDMSADSLGVFGAELADTSPTIDRLAREGMRFNQAHVVVGNCFPSRNVMWSGIYPHNTGIEGFYQIRNPQHLHLSDIMQRNGYYTGIFHKVSHSTPYHPYPSWDTDLTVTPDGKKRHIKAAQSYYDGMAQGIAEARAANKPFCLVMNTSDPHKPLYAQARDGSTIPDPHVPTRVFTPEEVPVPGFLFDDPVVRKELAHYYSSVRRADDCVAALMKALDESGLREETVILFLSDHGMPLPFAKTQVYHHSSSTPLFFIVPGLTQPDSVDDHSLVSAVDLLPTLIELTGVQHDGKMDGHSFASLLGGGSEGARDFVVKEYNENSGHWRDPMRAIQTQKYLYTFNPWSNGRRIMATATTGTPTYRRMAELAKTDPVIAARHDLYQHRVVEEFFDIEKDPDCLNNLMDSSKHQQALTKLQQDLEQWMVDTRDPMLDVFRHRDDPAARAAFIEAQQAEANARSGKNRPRVKS